MAPSELKRLASLEQMVDDIAAGLYRIPIGPGAINNKALKPKSVTAGTISVSDLESVNAKTGNLTANGTITVNSTGSIAIGKTSYADDSTGGMWVGYSGGTYKLNLGNSTYSVKWDGSALNITGNITATTGTIGGWTIGATDLTSDAGATGMASSGGYRLWVGNATPGSAPFRVTNAGVLTASGATITGGITASSLTITGTATFSGGSMTLPNGGSITSSTVDLNQGTLANLTVDGDITVGSGGKIKFGSGAADYLNNNILHFEVSSTEKAVIEWKNSTNTPYGRVSGNASSAGANSLIYADYNGSVKSYATFNGAYNGISTLGAFDLYAIRTGGTQEARLQGYADSSTQTVSAYVNGQSVFAFSNTNHFTRLMDSAGTYQFQIRDSGNVSVFAVTSDGDLVRPIANDATALGAYYGRIPIYINGTLKYLGVYS